MKHTYSDCETTLIVFGELLFRCSHKIFSEGFKSVPQQCQCHTYSSKEKPWPEKLKKLPVGKVIKQGLNFYCVNYISFTE